MSENNKARRLSIAGLYRLATRLHNALPYHLLRSGHAFPPWHYFLEVTRRCNQRCSMCQYINWLRATPGPEQAEGELTTEEWLRVIDQTGPLSLITFTGGEPWVRKDFGDILAHASRKRRTHFITNGSLMNEAAVRRCVELAPARTGGKGLAMIGLSLEGPGTVHDKIVNMKCAFDRAATSFHALDQARRDAGKRCPLVHVTTVVQEANLDALPEMPAVVAELGAHVLNLTLEARIHSLDGVGHKVPCDYRPEEIDVPRIDPGRLSAALEATHRAAEKAGVELRTPDMPREEFIRYYGGGLDLRDFTCRSGWTNVYVGAWGGVFPCLIFEAGNVREQPLKQIWNNGKMRWFRRHCRSELFPLCQGCCELEHNGKASKPAAPEPPGGAQT